MSQIRSDLKIIVIGSSGVGKTSFVNKWLKNKFIDTYKPTIVSEFGYKIYEYKNNSYRIQTWDIGGQEKSNSMTKIFSRDSHGCILILDINKDIDINEEIKWKKSVDENSVFIDDGKIPCILLLNKCDLIKDKNKLEEINNEYKTISEKFGFASFFITSVKDGINVDESMKFLIENIIDRIEKHGGNENFKENIKNTTKISRNSDESINKKKKKNCC